MASSPKSQRRSRKRRSPGTTPQPAPPPAATPRPASRPRPQARPQRSAQQQRDQTSLGIALTGKVYGDPPPSRFGGVPVAEIAILCGGIAVVIGLVSSVAAVLVVGIVFCTLGVIEWTAREHFSGYRSHATLLAGIPAVAIGVVLITLFSSSLRRGVLLMVVVPVFAVLFWLLRQRFRTARQARIVKPPTP